MRRFVLVALVSLLAVSTVDAQSLDENINATRDDQIRELFAEGKKLTDIGRFDEAALRFKDALLLEPQNKLVYEFYLKVGNEYLIRLSNRAELEDVLPEVLRKARIYQDELRRDPRYIDLLIAKLRASEKERLAATNELISVGPIAVPQLVEKLSDNRQEDYRVWCRMVLTRMGYRAVIPLTEALNSQDDRQAQSVATILADIADMRSLPKLQQLLDSEDSSETLKRVVRNAVATIAARTGMVDIPPGGDIYFQEALRYFRDGDQVRDEMIANEALTWRWMEDAPEDQFKLQYTVSPGYAWNELIAEELIYDGIDYYPETLGLHALLAADLSAQYVEVDQRLEMAKDRTIEAPSADETVESLQAREEAAAELRDRVEMLGGKAVYRGIQQAIVSERYDTAIGMMKFLTDPYLARPEQTLPDKMDGLLAELPGSVLVAALDHPEKRVRYQAAITLATLDPAIEFFNAEKVTPLLSDAVGEWGMLATLVIEPDFRHRNTARHQLMEQGILAFTANDGFQAMQRLNAAPFKDAVIIAGDLQPAVRDEYGVVVDVLQQTPLGLVQLLRNNERFAQVPIFISLPDHKELAHEIRTKLEGMSVVVDGAEKPLPQVIDGWVERPYDGALIKGKIEAALGETELPAVNRRQREAVSLAAATALAGVDPVTTQFDLPATADSLVAAIANRADPIRIQALTALGHTGVADKIDYVTEVYESQAEALEGKPAVRAAFLYAIGLLDPTTDTAQEIILAALKAEDREVRRQAHRALGHHPDLTNDARWDDLQQQRLDLRDAGNGQQAE